MIYYLEGSEKKGPFSKQELKELNLNSETLVYSEEWKSWQKIKELPELLIFLSTNDFEKKEISRESNIKDEVIIIKPVYLYFSLLLTSLILAFIFVSIRKKNDYTEITNKINNYFGENQSIADFDFGGIDGVFRKLSREPLYKDVLTDEVGFKKEKQVYDKDGNNPKEITFFKTVANTTKYKDWNKIVDYFDVECESTSRSLSIIRKETDTKFAFNYIVFLDMAYFVPEYVSYNYGYGVSGKNPTYRPSINKAYNDAALFLIEDKGANYVKESSNKIWSFDQIENEFYEIGNIYPKYIEFPSEFLLESYSKRKGNQGQKIYNPSKENGDYTFLSFADKESIVKYNESYQFTYDRYMTENANIHDSKSMVWYCEITNRYQIEEKESIFYKQLAIYTSVIFLILNLIYFVMKNKKKLKFI